MKLITINSILSLYQSKQTNSGHYIKWLRIQCYDRYSIAGRLPYVSFSLSFGSREWVSEHPKTIYLIYRNFYSPSLVAIFLARLHKLNLGLDSFHNLTTWEIPDIRLQMSSVVAGWKGSHGFILRSSDFGYIFDWREWKLASHEYPSPCEGVIEAKSAHQHKMDNSGQLLLCLCYGSSVQQTNHNDPFCVDVDPSALMTPLWRGALMAC